MRVELVGGKRDGEWIDVPVLKQVLLLPAATMEPVEQDALEWPPLPSCPEARSDLYELRRYTKGGMGVSMVYFYLREVAR